MMGAMLFAATVATALLTGFVSGALHAHRKGRSLVKDEGKALHTRRMALLILIGLVAATIKTGV